MLLKNGLIGWCKRKLQISISIEVGLSWKELILFGHLGVKQE